MKRNELYDIIFIVLAAIVFLSACSNEETAEIEEDTVDSSASNSVEVEESEEVEAEEEVEEIEEDDEKFLIEKGKPFGNPKNETESTVSDDIQFMEELTLITLQESAMGDYLVISFIPETKTFEMIPYEADLILAFQMFGEGIVPPGWEDVVQATVGLSEETYKALGDGYTFKIMNPFDTTRAFLLVYDGIVAYDVADDVR